MARSAVRTEPVRIVKTRTNRFRINVYAANGRVIVTSGAQTYHRERDARRALARASKVLRAAGY